MQPTQPMQAVPPDTPTPDRASLTLALQALRRLRDGLDPSDGVPLPSDHPFQRSDVVRALFAGVAALEREVAACPEPERTRRAPSATAPRSAPPNQGRPWSQEDDGRLAEAFDGGATLSDLAAAFGRSKNSIRSRLLLLGRGELEGGPAPRWPISRGPDSDRPVPTLEPEPAEAEA